MWEAFQARLDAEIKADPSLDDEQYRTDRQDEFNALAEEWKGEQRRGYEGVANSIAGMPVGWQRSLNSMANDERALEVADMRRRILERERFGEVEKEMRDAGLRSAYAADAVNRKRTEDQQAFESRVRKLADEVSQGVDPNRIYKERGTVGNILAMIAAGLGAAGAVLAKSPNYAMEAMQKAIDRDIAAQKATISAKRSSIDAATREYQLMMERFDGMEGAEAAKNMAAWEQISGTLAGFRNENMTQGMKERLGVMEDHARQNRDIAEQKLLHRGMVTREQQLAREYNDLMRRQSGSGSPKRELPPGHYDVSMRDYQERYIGSLGGYAYGGTKDDIEKLKEQSAARQAMVNDLNLLRRLARDDRVALYNPLSASYRAAQGARNRIANLKIQSITGAAIGNEREERRLRTGIEATKNPLALDVALGQIEEVAKRIEAQADAEQAILMKNVDFQRHSGQVIRDEKGRPRAVLGPSARHAGPSPETRLGSADRDKPTPEPARERSAAEYVAKGAKAVMNPYAPFGAAGWAAKKFFGD